MLWMAASGLVFSVLNALLKQLSHEMEPWLAGFLRYLVGTLIVMAFLLRRGLRQLWPRRPRLQFARGALHAVGTMFWFAAVPGISLAELTAIAFSLPIWICIGAVLFLGERMSAVRWGAVFLGFTGVLLVVDPFGAGGFAGVSASTLLLLASAPAFSLSFLVAKVLTRTERTDVMVLWQHFWASALLAPIALAYWAAPTVRQWLLFAACGVFGGVAHYCATQAFRIADLSAVQPVKFLDLVWASMLGFIVFGAVPAGATIAGGVVILASTLWLARREARGT
jgi:drug/metabolite transporter (DMT)-like permease